MYIRLQSYIGRIYALAGDIHVMKWLSGVMLCAALVSVGSVVYILGKQPKVTLTDWRKDSLDDNPLIGGYVASKTGTTYYFPWCGNALRIKPDKLVVFGSRKLAQQAGFRPAKACHGLIASE